MSRGDEKLGRGEEVVEGLEEEMEIRPLRAQTEGSASVSLVGDQDAIWHASLCSRASTCSRREGHGRVVKTALVQWCQFRFSCISSLGFEKTKIEYFIDCYCSIRWSQLLCSMLYKILLLRRLHFPPNLATFNHRMWRGYYYNLFVSPSSHLEQRYAQADPKLAIVKNQEGDCSFASER